MNYDRKKLYSTGPMCRVKRNTLFHMKNLLFDKTCKKDRINNLNYFDYLVYFTGIMLTMQVMLFQKG